MILRSVMQAFYRGFAVLYSISYITALKVDCRTYSVCQLYKNPSDIHCTAYSMQYAGQNHCIRTWWLANLQDAHSLALLYSRFSKALTGIWDHTTYSLFLPFSNAKMEKLTPPHSYSTALPVQYISKGTVIVWKGKSQLFRHRMHTVPPHTFSKIVCLQC